MSAPTPPSRPPSHRAAHPTPFPDPWRAPRAVGRVDPGATFTRPLIRRRRTVLGTAFDVVARIGTAVTLAALFVVIGAALATAGTTPTPAGVATADR